MPFLVCNLPLTSIQNNFDEHMSLFLSIVFFMSPSAFLYFADLTPAAWLMLWKKGSWWPLGGSLNLSNTVNLHPMCSSNAQQICQQWRKLSQDTHVFPSASASASASASVLISQWLCLKSCTSLHLHLLFWIHKCVHTDSVENFGTL